MITSPTLLNQCLGDLQELQDLKGWVMSWIKFEQVISLNVNFNIEKDKKEV